MLKICSTKYEEEAVQIDIELNAEELEGIYQDNIYLDDEEDEEDQDDDESDNDTAL